MDKMLTLKVVYIVNRSIFWLQYCLQITKRTWIRTFFSILISCHYVFSVNQPLYEYNYVHFIIFFVDSIEARDFILIRKQANTVNADAIRNDGNCEYNRL